MQVLDIPINDLTPNGRAFNCSIIQAYGATRLFFRFERFKNYNTEIGVIDLDERFRPVERTYKHIKLIRFSSKVTTFDDPRAFIFNGDLYFMYSNGLVDHRGWCAGVALAEMKKMHLTKQMVPKFGANFNQAVSGSQLWSQEKNWSPFEHKSKLHFIYTINPLVVVEWDLKSNNCVKVSESKFDQKFWEHGDFLGGGTPLIKKGDEYIGFFHTFTDDHSGTPGCRQYHVGFYAIKFENGGWKVSRISRKPILSAKRDEVRDLRGSKSTWRPNCIFPCGFVERIIEGKDSVVISQGWQDCRCELVIMPWEEVLQDVVSLPYSVAGTEVQFTPEVKKGKSKKIPTVVC